MVQLLGRDICEVVKWNIGNFPETTQKLIYFVCIKYLDGTGLYFIALTGFKLFCFYTLILFIYLSIFIIYLS